MSKQDSMGEFVRARSAEQKELRMEEIKEAADRLFAERPYHEITLTTIAESLTWTRANLYKYVSSKEDVFLELCSDKMEDYFESLMAAFPAGCGYSLQVYSEVWAGILNAHTSYLNYADILLSIIETNVSLERLAAFKKKYYDLSGALSKRLAENIGITESAAYSVTLSTYYHAIGMNGHCMNNKKILEALELAGIDPPNIDFVAEMKDFILMNLQYRVGTQAP